MKIIAHFLEMLGIEPWTSYMKSRRSTGELHPHLMRVFSAFVDLETLQIQLWEIICMKVIEQCLEIHWATSPLNESLFCVCRFKNTINPVVGNYQDISEIILLKFSWKSLNNNKCLEVLGIEPRTSYMRSMRSTTELHPLSKKSLLLL